MCLKGKVALVTGSTSGIGLAIACELAKAGAALMLNGFGEVEQACKMVGALTDKADYHGADLSQPAQVEEMITYTEQRLGPVDILVNNAGIQYVSPLEQFPMERWDAIIAINLSAAFHTIRLTLPAMKKRDFGRIINIASAHGLVASVGKAAYVAAKHGLIGLTKVAALESAAFNVTANAICPGWVLTPLAQKQINDRAAAEGIKVELAQHEILAEKQPSLKFVTPEQIGQLAVFLAGDAAREMRGAAIPIDGGWTAQ